MMSWYRLSSCLGTGCHDVAVVAIILALGLRLFRFFFSASCCAMLYLCLFMTGCAVPMSYCNDVISICCGDIRTRPIRCVGVLHVKTVLSTRRHAAHPLSSLILHPREIQAQWSQNYNTGSDVLDSSIHCHAIVLDYDRHHIHTPATPIH